MPLGNKNSNSSTSGKKKRRSSTNSSRSSGSTRSSSRSSGSTRSGSTRSSSRSSGSTRSSSRSSGSTRSTATRRNSTRRVSRQRKKNKKKKKKKKSVKRSRKRTNSGRFEQFLNKIRNNSIPGVKKLMESLKKIQRTKPIREKVNEYKKKYHPKFMSYLIYEDYIKNKKKKKHEKMEEMSKKMTMSDFIERLKKDVNDEDFIKQCKAMSEQAKGNKGGGQRGGGWITAKFFVTFINITMGISAIYILYTGSAAQTTMQAGFTALLTGNCNTFGEGAFRYLGFGNPVCDAYGAALTNVLLAVTGNPTAIAKITGFMVVMMKTPKWAPRMHCAIMKKVATIFVIGGVIDEGEIEAIENMYSRFPPLMSGRTTGRITGRRSGSTSGPDIDIVDE